MPRVQYDISISKNDGLSITAAELIDKYFFGAQPKKKDGTSISMSTIESYIRDAQSSIEGLLNVLLQYQYVEENTFFEQQAFVSWIYTKTTYPVDQPIMFEGFISNIRQVKYPSTWISVKRETSSRKEQDRHRRISIVPGGGASPVSSAVIFAGMTPHIGLMNMGLIADYWHVSYTTGFNKIPENIISVISKKAAIPILAMLGDLVLGAGINSKSLSIDGLSQTISSTKSGDNGAYAARIKDMRKEMEDELKILKAMYCDFSMSVL